MVVEFLIQWATFYIAIMFAMSTDNIFWITSSPEWKDKNFHKMTRKLGKSVKHFTWKEKIEYAIRHRIIPVLTDTRDIYPGLMTSFILAVFL